MHLSREFPKSRVILFSGPTAQLSPFTTVAGGTFMRVHVTFNDVIGSHLSRFSLHPTGTWYFAMCPRYFLEKSDGQIFLRSTVQILSGFWASNRRCAESPIQFYRAFATRDLAPLGLKVPYTWALTLRTSEFARSLDLCHLSSSDGRFPVLSPLCRFVSSRLATLDTKFSALLLTSSRDAMCHLSACRLLWPHTVLECRYPDMTSARPHNTELSPLRHS
jgi:hypothetical protein